MLKNWLSNVFTHGTQQQLRNARRRNVRKQSAAALESLEQRTLLTAYLVDTTEDGSVAADGMISLREAITAANTNATFLDAAAGEAGPGVIDTISFSPALNGMTITLNGNALTISDDLVISDSNASGTTIDADGRSRVFDIVDGTGTVSISDITITGGLATNGGGIQVNEGETLNLTNVTVDANASTGLLATEGGAGVFNDGGTVNIAGSTISNNTTVGATTVTLSGDQEVPAVTTSATGSADFHYNPGTGTFDVDLFVSGIAVANITGAHIHAAAAGENGPVIVNLTNLGSFVAEAGGARLVLNDVAFPANNAEALLSGGTYFNVHSTANAGGEVRGQITYAATSGSGGGILNNDGTITVTDTVITGNTASRAGGGIETIAGAVNLTNVTLDNNVAGPAGSSNPGNGGGLHVTGAGTVNVTGGTVSGNMAASEGGGLWNGSGIMTITGGTVITENIANGLLADQGGAGVFNAGGTVNIDGVTITNNTTVGSTTVALSGDQEVPAVTTSATGSADFHYNPGTGTFDVDLFVSGIALADITGAHIHAAAAGENGPVIVNLTNLGSFVAEAGGARLVLNDVVFPSNNAESLLSGGTYFNVHSTANAGGEVRGQITFTATSGSGGGILNDQGTVTVANSTITGNTASRAGGGIESVAGAVTLTNVTLDNNVAGPAGAATPGNGGGLHVTGSGTVTVTGGTVVGNTAASEGGGLWNGTGTMTITGNTLISDNAANGTASDQGGAGVFNAGGTVNIDGVTISNNTTIGSTTVALSGDQEVPAITTSASGSSSLHYNPGVGTLDVDLFVSGIALADITGAHIHAAAAGSNGPVIVNLTNLGSFVADGGGVRLVLNDVVFPAENVQALFSGGTYFNVHSTSNAGGEVRGQITFAATSGSGGGILNDQGTVTVVNSTITGNATNRAGGGIETVAGSVTLTNVTLDNNIAGPAGAANPGNGGGLHTSAAGVVSITGGTVSGNKAGSEGGGLWNSVAGTMTINGTTIDGNTAVEGGGVFNDATDGTATQEFSLNVTELNGSGVTGSGAITLSQPTATTREIRVVINATGMEDLTSFGGFHVAHIHGQFAGNRTAPLLGQGDGAFFDGAGGTANGQPPVNSILPSVAANDGVTIMDGFLDFLEGRPEYGPVLLNLTSTQMRDAGTHGTNPPDGTPPLAHFLNLFTNGDIDPTTLFPQGTDFVLDTTYTFDLTNADEARQFNNLAPLDLREVVIHGASIDKAISDAIDAAAMGTAPGGTDLGDGTAFRVTAPVAAAEIVAASGSIDISNAVISNNTATGDGGGLLNETGAVTVVDTDFTGNVSGGDEPGEGGGAIFNHGTLAISGGTISGNTATAGLGNGGGIHNSATGTLTVIDTMITGNDTARAGGGIESAGTVELTNVTLTDNHASINGGGLHVSSPGTTAIVGGTVSGNVAEAEGGGLWNGLGIMTITGGTVITDNIANGLLADQGGAGVFNAGGTVNIDGVTITNNTTVGSTTVALSGDQEIPAVTTSAAGSADFHYNPGTGTFDVDLFVSGIAVADITGAHIHAAAAGENGPVIVNLTNLSSFVAETGGARLVLNDVAFPANNAEALLSGGTYFNVHSTANAGGEVRGQITFTATSGSGGGILNDQGTVTVANSTITGNSTSRAGGGIESVAGAVTLTNVTLDNNVAGPAGAATPGNGGGLHVTGSGTVTVTGGTVVGNTAASEGGGLWNGTGTMTITGNTLISDNAANGTASDQGGAGVFNAGGTVNIDGVTISNNTTIGSTTVALSGDQEVPAITTLASGSASLHYNPGVGTLDVDLFVSGIALADITGAHIHAAAAGSNGPVIVNLTNLGSFVADGGGVRLVLNDVVFPAENVQALFSGGTYFNVHSTSNAGGEVRGQITFAATSGSGGGILNDQGTVTVVNSTITGNATNRAGGGIETVAGSVTIQSSVLANNVAQASPGNGGALHISGAADVVIHNTTVSGNTAQNEGAGLWNSGTGSLTLRNVTVAANDVLAENAGGGIFTVDGGTTVLLNTLVAGNTAGANNDTNDIVGTIAAGSTNNLVADASTSGGLVDTTDGNIVGIAGSGVRPLDTIVDSTLAADGTHLLVVGSVALEAGVNLSADGITTDQTGTARPIGTAFDIGAIEASTEVLNGQNVTINETVAVTEGQSAVFTVTLNQDPVSTVTVVVLTSDGNAIAGSDYVTTTQTFTFQPGGTLARQFSVPTINDSIFEDVESFTATITSSAGAAIINASGTAQVTDNDLNGRPLLDSVGQFPGSQPTLSWETVDGADGYEVWLARIFPSQARLQIGSSTTATTSFVPDALDAGFYRYWVRATNSSGRTSQWSSSNSFEVRPTLVGPFGTQFSLRPTFRWDEIPLTSGYQLFIRTSTGDIIIDDVQSTSFTPSTDLPEGPVRWWIRSSDATGNRGWSTVGTYSLQTEVLTPSGSESDTTPTFTWGAAENASRYILHVLNVDTNEVVIRENELTTTSFTPTSALAAGNYRTWVKAIGSSGNFGDGRWSQPVDFIIAANVPSESDGLLDDQLLVLASQFEVNSDAAATKTESIPHRRQSDTNPRAVAKATTEAASHQAVTIPVGILDVEDTSLIDQWMAKAEAVAELLS